MEKRYFFTIYIPVLLVLLTAIGGFYIEQDLKRFLLRITIVLITGYSLKLVLDKIIYKFNLLTNEEQDMYVDENNNSLKEEFKDKYIIDKNNYDYVKFIILVLAINNIFNFLLGIYYSTTLNVIFLFYIALHIYFNKIYNNK